MHEISFDNRTWKMVQPNLALFVGNINLTKKPILKILKNRNVHKHCAWWSNRFTHLTAVRTKIAAEI